MRGPGTRSSAGPLGKPQAEAHKRAGDVVNKDQGGLWLGSYVGLSHPAPETGWSPRLAFCLSQDHHFITPGPVHTHTKGPAGRAAG